MLDCAYRSLSAFCADCLLCGVESWVLITSGAYVVQDDGSVISADYL